MDMIAETLNLFAEYCRQDPGSKFWLEYEDGTWTAGCSVKGNRVVCLASNLHHAIARIHTSLIRQFAVNCPSCHSGGQLEQDCCQERKGCCDGKPCGSNCG